MARTGRRPGASGAREAILEAARETFAQHGYDGSTIRAIARAAGVDPALVHHYFGSKEELFAATMELPVNPADVLPGVLAGDTAELGERLARLFLGVWDGAASRRPLIALVRSATSNELAAAMVREFVEHALLGRIAARLESEDAELRASLVASQMVGLAIARYVLRLEPIASSEPEAVVAALAPNLQRYLTGDIGRPVEDARLVASRPTPTVPGAPPSAR